MPRPKARQMAISDFFKRSPAKAQKRRSTDSSDNSVSKAEDSRNLESPPRDAMQIDPPADPARELTQEELDVHDQLESLECSSKRPRRPVEDNDRTPPHGDTSDGDDSDDSLEDIKRDVVLRRSSRSSKEVVRFGSELAQRRGMSVFGNEFSKTTSNGTLIRRALKDVNQKERLEQQLDEMRKEADEAGMAGQDETLFQEMADAEERAERIRHEALDKYSAPLPLFCGKVVMKSMPKQQKRQRSGTYAAHPVHDLIVHATKTGDENADIALSFLVPIVKRDCRMKNTKGLARVADYLFQLAVFDRTDHKPEVISRDLLVDTIEDIVCADLDAFRLPGKGPRLPNIMSVLKCYGAIFDDESDPSVVGDITAGEDSLDKQAPLGEVVDKDDIGGSDTKDKKENKDEREDKEDSGPAPVSAEFNRCERNVGRLFRVAALQVNRGVPLSLVLSNAKLGLQESVLKCLGVCTRVLLSAFGNRLYPQVGELVEACISLISDSEWPEFRMRAAAYMHSFTTRLELHVELVTYLMPVRKARSRSLSLDIAYLSLQQWCSSNTPSAITTKPSPRAQQVGLKNASFCLTDVVRLMHQIPELSLKIDMIWVSLLARLLKVLLTDSKILERRLVGEMGSVKKVLVKMKVKTRQFQLDVPVQRMRIALDGVERVLLDFAKGGEKGELGFVMDGKKQASLQTLTPE